MAKSIGIGKAKQNYAGSHIPDLDGVIAKIGGKAEGDAYCTMCGEKDHKASSHAGGKAMVRDCDTAGEPEEGESGPTGEALKNDRETQYGYPKEESELTTGTKNYKLPGERSGKTVRIFG